jgi:hypothetical protein
MLISDLAQLRASAVDAAKPKLAKTPDSGTFTWRCRSRFLTDRCRRFAGLRLNGLIMVPSEFDVSFDNFRTMRRCRLIWRDDDFVGASFQS